MNQSLRAQLLSMAKEDTQVRTELAADGSLFDGYHPRMAEVHSRNAAKLDKIIDGHGWPGESLVGNDGARAAWLIAQHAIGSPALQRRCLPLLEEASDRGDVPAGYAAMLFDRIRFNEGRPQRYGSIFDWDEHGGISPAPIEDPERVEELRASVGLPSLEEVIQKTNEEQAQSPPRQRLLAERRAEMKAWARSVGWQD